MTVSIQIDPETGMAIATCSGIQRINDAQEGVTMLWETPDWPGSLAVWDFRGAQFDVSFLDVQKIAQFVLQNQPTKPPEKVAFVTTRDLDFGMSRVFEVFRQDPRTAFRVFRDYDEAVAWVRSP